MIEYEGTELRRVAKEHEVTRIFDAQQLSEAFLLSKGVITF